MFNIHFLDVISNHSLDAEVGKFLQDLLYMLTFYFGSTVFRTTRMYWCSIMVVGELELSRFLFSDPRLAQNPCKNSTTKIVKVNFMEPERDIERTHIHDDVAQS